MFSVSDSWLGFGVVVIMGLIIVGLSTFLGKLIIWLFGPESVGEKPLISKNRGWSPRIMKRHDDQSQFSTSPGSDHESLSKAVPSEP